MQTELLNRKRWSTRVELASAMFEYVELQIDNCEKGAPRIRPPTFDPSTEHEHPRPNSAPRPGLFTLTGSNDYGRHPSGHRSARDVAQHHGVRTDC